MTRETGVRLAILYVPLAVTALLWRLRRPDRRLGAAVLLAACWNLWTLQALNLVAVRAGWWSFDANGPDLLGLPADVLIGWSSWWGAVAVLVPLRIPWLVASAAVIDIFAMPAAAPVVTLGRHWPVGEVLALTVCLVPGLLLARWTADDRRLGARIVLQVLAATGVMVGIVVAVGTELRGLDLRHVLARPAAVTAIAASFLGVFALVAVTAVREFGERGLGTPIPFDPPRRLVVTGPYAYVRNPMQAGMLGVYAFLSAVLWTPWLLVAVVVGSVYAAGLASWHEDAELRERFGDGWVWYRRRVRRWLPRWRPRGQPSPARLYVAASCVACSSLGRWIADRGPVSLDLLAAEDAPDLECERLTYIGPDGYHCQGIAALARALEHLNLGWALAGWVLRLPVVCQLVQLIGDAVGAGPRRLPTHEANETVACPAVREAG